MKISVLFSDARAKNKTESHVLRDCGLYKIIPKSYIDIFSEPCVKADILARQEIFKKLDDSSFCGAFTELSDALSEFSMAKNVYESAETPCERLFVFSNYLKSFGKAINLMSSLLGGCILIDSLRLYAEERAEKLRGCASLSDEYSLLLGKISKSQIHFSYGRAYLIKDDGAEHTSVTDEILRCKKQLGYGDSASGGDGIRMSLPISEGFEKLYKAESDRLCELEKLLSVCIDDDISWLKREIDFYISIRELTQKARDRGIPFCFAEVSDKPCFSASDMYDITLLSKKQDEGAIVPNDAFFSDSEPEFFLTGANGGGKTTYLRAVASNLLLFLAGCPVFCESACIYPFSSVFTHFPSDEHFDAGGRLWDEKRRVDEIISKSDGGTFAFFNETFTGADDIKGLSLSVEAMKKLSEQKAFCLFVTHFHEVDRGDFPVLCAGVDTDDENRRTFKITRGAGNRKSYAADILRKYGLDRASLEKQTEGELSK